MTLSVISRSEIPTVGVNTLNAYSTLYTNTIQSPQRHDNYAVILALRLELVIAYQESGDYSSASVTV